MKKKNSAAGPHIEIYINGVIFNPLLMSLDSYLNSSTRAVQSGQNRLTLNIEYRKVKIMGFIGIDSNVDIGSNSISE